MVHNFVQKSWYDTYSTRYHHYFIKWYWSISLDPLDTDLGEGTFTLVAKASFGANTSGESAPKTLTIDCVVPPPVITQPDTQDCEGDITISGTANRFADTVNLFIQGGAQIGIPMISMI